MTEIMRTASGDAEPLSQWQTPRFLQTLRALTSRTIDYTVLLDRAQLLNQAESQAPTYIPRLPLRRNIAIDCLGIWQAEDDIYRLMSQVKGQAYAQLKRKKVSYLIPEVEYRPGRLYSEDLPPSATGDLE